MHKQSKTVLLISIVAVAIVVGVAYQNVLISPLDDYGTGLSADTSTNFYSHEKVYDPNQQTRPGDPYDDWTYIQGSGREVLAKDKYIVTWQEAAHESELITARADFQYHSRGTHEGLGGACGYIYGVVLGLYRVRVDYIDLSGKTTNIINTANNYYNVNYVTVDRKPSAGFVMGEGHQLPNAAYKYYTYAGGLGLVNAPWTETNYGMAQWYVRSTETLEFKMKGRLPGMLRYVMVMDVYERKNVHIFCGWEWIKKEVSIAVDECYLASGEGSFEILSSNSVGNAGSEQTEHTNETVSDYYTKYIYEEGQTVQISVKTGFGGWYLKVYGTDGYLDQETPIDDDVSGFIVEYPIPMDSFIQGGENEFRVELWNTLFKQAEIKLGVVKDLEAIPFRPIVTTTDVAGNLKTKFMQGDMVYVKLQAEANPKGTGEITKFWAEGKYGTITSVNYAFSEPNIPASLVSGYTYSGAFSFQLSSDPQEYGTVTIRVHAVDKWGQKGVEFIGNIFSKKIEGAYAVTIVAKSDGMPVSNALVTMGGQSGITDPSGNAVIYLEYGTYSLSVTKAGYKNYYRRDITIQGDTTIPVELETEWIPGDYLILIGIIIVAVVGIGIYLYQKRGKGFKMPKIFRRGK